MKICIYYDSITGNTKKIADAIYETCKDEVLYCGKPQKLQEADLYFIGSWTDKGNCSSVIQNLLSSLKNKKIAYFGTCGFEDHQNIMLLCIKEPKIRLMLRMSF